MNEAEPQSSYISPVEVVKERQTEPSKSKLGMRTIEYAASFLLGLSVMMLLCQLFPFKFWAENARSLLPFEEVTTSEVDMQMWKDYYWCFFYFPAMYWFGVFWIAIAGSIATFRSECPRPATLICLGLIPMSAIGFFVASGTGFAPL
ncbi:hypothetical protein DTL42_17270 [Bremerella cremea]|uniref:Uncharacterized protein n=1 Tax=Bremerella cremea TaxID=1031537 RepID=A0A368KN55_9BACT|nr:hypothetical protein [Bremerella cremea]RCS44673.1 hypothetical protein DTL42_17270 [Bremerella cremea]